MLIPSDHKASVAEMPLSLGYNDDEFDPQFALLRPSERPRRDIDKPIRPLLIIPNATANETLGLTSLATKQRETEALSLILANFLRKDILRDRKWIHYARNRNHYSECHIRYYYPNCYTHTYITRVIGRLEMAGLIENEIAPAGPNSWFRSRLRPTREFAARLRKCQLRPRSRPEQLIVLKDQNKHLISFNDTPDTVAWRNDITEQNEALTQFEISLPTHGLSQDLLWAYGLDFPIHHFTGEMYYRIFNAGWHLGGRFYGPLWQRLPKGLRPQILIDGSPTVEPDLKCCHPRLLCAMAGIELPFHDPAYDFYDEFRRIKRQFIPRKGIKSAFGMILCASSKTSAIRALAKELTKHSIPNAFALAKEVITSMIEAMPKLAPYFCTGIGLRLQNVDAGICARVQKRCRAQDFACLSIHDGFRVKTEHEDFVVEVMEEEMYRACAKLSV